MAKVHDGVAARDVLISEAKKKSEDNDRGAGPLVAWFGAPLGARIAARRAFRSVERHTGSRPLATAAGAAAGLASFFPCVGGFVGMEAGSKHRSLRQQSPSERADFKASCQQLATQVLALLQDADTVSLDADAASLIGADAAWLTDDDDCRPLLDTRGVS